jgi:hypothetical protein
VKYLVAATKYANNDPSADVMEGSFVSEILVLYDGTTIQSTQYATLSTNTDISISFSLDGSTFSIDASCSDASAADYYLFSLMRTQMSNVR